MNRVILMGRLTRDPEIRWTQGQDQRCIARFTLAVDRRGKKKEGQQNADFIPCVAFEKWAENMERYCFQGTKILLQGRIQTGSYTNRDGEKVYTTNVVVDDWEFAESKGAGSSGSSGKSAPREESGSQESDEGFMNIPNGVEDEGLPFN